MFRRRLARILQKTDVLLLVGRKWNESALSGGFGCGA